MPKDEMFQLLKEEYNKIITETSDLSPYSRQSIELLKEDEEDYEYKFSDVRDIILTFLAISLKNTQSDKTNSIKELIYSDTKMYKKLGLYAINLNIKKYVDLFLEFLKKLPDKRHNNGIIQGR